jgi:hypothetical protein
MPVDDPSELRTIHVGFFSPRRVTMAEASRDCGALRFELLREGDGHK